MNNMIEDGIYLHINNGGVSFAVTNEDGLALEIEASHFGNTTNKMKLFVKRDSLRKLGQMLIVASEQDEQKEVEYLSLECYSIDRVTGKTKRFNDSEVAAGTTTSETQQKII